MAKIFKNSRFGPSYLHQNLYERGIGLMVEKMAGQVSRYTLVSTKIARYSKILILYGRNLYSHAIIRGIMDTDSTSRK